MKFDVIVGNPPFNLPAQNSGPTGTSGHTTLYKRFIALSLARATVVAMVVQRNGVRYANSIRRVGSYCLDTDQHWDYAAGWFITDGTVTRDSSTDLIVRLTYCLDEQWQYSAPSSGSYENNSDYSDYNRGSDVYGVADTPTVKHPSIRRAWFAKPNRTGPHLLFKGLEALNSYVVVDEPSRVSSAAALLFDTIDEAARARLFILNNPIVSYLKRRTGERTRGMVFRYIKRFDLSQITTGHEIPVEFGLTVAEIQHLKFVI